MGDTGHESQHPYEKDVYFFALTPTVSNSLIIPPDWEPARHEFDLTTISGLEAAMRARVASISFSIQATLIESRSDIASATEIVEQWIRQETIVRVIGAGRALLAAAIPANRLAHAGARVSVLHDVVPLPNSRYGGAILAASASGLTPSVLEIMRKAKRRNPEIFVLGIASARAHEFRSLCDVAIGIDYKSTPYRNPLQALADTEEYIISEILDAIVVAAARRVGLTENDLRGGHEDLGDTGPYLPEGVQ